MVAKQHSCTLGTLASKVPFGVHGIVVVVFMPTHKLIVLLWFMWLVLGVQLHVFPPALPSGRHVFPPALPSGRHVFPRGVQSYIW